MSAPLPPLLPDATRTLAEFSANMHYDQIPAAVIEKMKTSLLDSIGCCLFGMTLPWTKHVQAMIEAEECTPAASLFGTGRRTSVAGAVLVNATAGHAFELDDIHKESIVHPGSIALPVVAALSEKIGRVDGRRFLTAFVAGYEVGTRVGNAATMSLFYRGFHPQGTSGSFVAAAAAAKMLGLDAERTLHALGVVGSQAGGLMAAQEGAMVKRFHSGRAAQSGVYSALLAERGFTGITNVLEAAYGGYLSTYSEKPNAQRLLDGLGSEWEAGKIGYKPYAAVTSIHSALDALLALMQVHALTPDDIVSVRVGTSHMTYVHCAWEYKAQGVTAAQMNLFYSLAVVAHDGVAFVEQYDSSRLADPALLSFIDRIEAYADPEIDAMGPAYRHAARVSITMKDGRSIDKEIFNRRGSPENPLAHEDVVKKFRAVTQPAIPADRIEEIIELVRDVDTAKDVSPLLAALALPLKS
ncbi:MmgE/PrpD family protein [Alcaligenaceae bacterium]|nr:MmgE/PrpD family protein [Alcaligenaceae bacterium]